MTEKRGEEERADRWMFQLRNCESRKKKKKTFTTKKEEN